MSDKKNYPTRMHEVLGIEKSDVIYEFTDIDGDYWFSFFLHDDGTPYHSDGVALDRHHVIYLINHPERIIRKPRLTQEHLYALTALKKLFGMKWMAKDEDNTVTLFRNRPEKSKTGWGANGGIMWADTMTIDLSALVSWSDPEPLDIVATLKAAGVEVE